MDQTVTITQLDRSATEWIKQEAQRTGQSVDVIVRQLIYRGLEIERQQARRQRYHDLDQLAGTWSEEDAKAFHDALADLSRIDPNMWP